MITLEYLQNLSRAYDIFIADISRVIPIIKVNWSEFRDAEVGQHAVGGVSGD